MPSISETNACVFETKKAEHNERTVQYLLLKIAARCNLNCSYCYWFRDNTVYDKPAVLTLEAEDALLEKLATHIQRYQLKSFDILFHGGEPLLFGKRRFAGLCRKLRELEARSGSRLSFSITSNGVLIDREWTHVLRDFDVHVTLSIDGPEPVHDRHRVDHKGRGTFYKTIEALDLLRAVGIEPGVLAVCNPDRDPEELFNFFVRELEIGSFDILVPDATHEDQPKSISRYYAKLFDLWYGFHASGRVKIRYLETVTKGLLGFRSWSESIGYRPVQTCTMLTDGSLEPLDVLRITHHGSTRTDVNIFDNDLQDIERDPLWREVWAASLDLPVCCVQCRYKNSCGGGHIASRWSQDKRYNNPSVYCADIKEIMGHVWQRLSEDLSRDETVDNVIRLLRPQFSVHGKRT
jgi:uncharacterized protein